MKATAYTDLLVLFVIFGGIVLATLWSESQRLPAAPVSPEEAFSPQMRALLTDILDKEHARQLRLHRHYPTPDDMMDVDKSSLLNRKDGIAHAATNRGDLALVGLLTILGEWKKNVGAIKTEECRQSIEHLLEQNALGPVILLPDR